ncbi:MAG: hypothetical protein GY906_13795, partial [bacterium]|nr:hypothetical protein [bacterium]
MAKTDPENRDDQIQAKRPGLIASVWRSIFPRGRVPVTERERARFTLNTLVLHFRPARVPVDTIRFTHTFGLGGTCLVLILMLAATGALMMFVYQPSSELAYDSVRALESEVVFGSLVRGVHYWC